MTTSGRPDCELTYVQGRYIDELGAASGEFPRKRPPRAKKRHRMRWRDLKDSDGSDPEEASGGGGGGAPSPTTTDCVCGAPDLFGVTCLEATRFNVDVLRLASRAGGQHCRTCCDAAQFLSEVDGDEATGKSGGIIAALEVLRQRDAVQHRFDDRAEADRVAHEIAEAERLAAERAERRSSASATMVPELLARQLASVDADDDSDDDGDAHGGGSRTPPPNVQERGVGSDTESDDGGGLAF